MKEDRIKLSFNKDMYDFLLTTLKDKVRYYDILREGKHDESTENEKIVELIELYKTVNRYKREDIIDGETIVSVYLYPTKVIVLVRELLEFLKIIRDEDMTYEAIESYKLLNETPLEDIDYKKLYEDEKGKLKELQKEFDDYKNRIASFATVENESDD